MKMLWKNGALARSLRQKADVSATRGQRIDYPNTGKKEGQLGIKQKIILCYRGMGIEEARKLFNDLNKIGYPQTIFDEWIAESNFQNDVQKTYREKGEAEALQLFQTRNNGEFNGKFSKGTFLNWKNEAGRIKDEKGR